jgi:hypothetical protein
MTKIPQKNLFGETERDAYWNRESGEDCEEEEKA